RLQLGSPRTGRARPRGPGGGVDGSAAAGWAPDRHRRPHGQGKRCLVHGGAIGLALQESGRGAARNRVGRTRGRRVRTETIDALTAYARVNPDLILLTADLGYSVLENFAETLPAQYANVGVCEQAMAGLAAGLALSGRRVVLYSIANFPTLRCLEQL